MLQSVPNSAKKAAQNAASGAQSQALMERQLFAAEEEAKSSNATMNRVISLKIQSKSSQSTVVLSSLENRLSPTLLPLPRTRTTSCKTTALTAQSSVACLEVFSAASASAVSSVELPTGWPRKVIRPL